MKMMTLLAATFAAAAAPTYADVAVMDAYARVATPMSKSGAAFMMIHNTGPEERRLVSADSDAAKRVEIHTHTETDGVMKMHEIEGGIVLPAGQAHTLARGGDHLMFMGLTDRWDQGDTIFVTLTFENGETLEIEIPVDLERRPEQGGHAKHSH